MTSRRRSDDVDQSPTTEAVPVRAAHPSRSLVALTPVSSFAASTLGTAAIAASWGALGPQIGDQVALGVGGGVAALIAAGVGLKFRGRTVGQWLRLRRENREEICQAALFARDNGIGMVFDGTAATAFVEITPRSWQVTSIDSRGWSEAPQIEADVLRRQLSAYGIDISRITVINAGYKFAARDTAAGVLDTLIGPVTTPLGGTTVIAVSIELNAASLDAANSRAQRGSMPSGLYQAVKVAATRVQGALREQGFGGRLMRSEQVRDFHDTVLAQVWEPMTDPRWTSCGKRSKPHTRTFSPARGHWNEQSAGAWHHLQAHRQYTTLTITPASEGRAFVQPLVTYMVRSGDALSRAESFGLVPAAGQQAVGLAQSLPVTTRPELRSTSAVIDDNTRLGFGIPSGGAGLFVGVRSDRARVFVAVPAAEEPMWLSGPVLFAAQLVARLSTQDLRIAVMIDSPVWQALVDHRASEDLVVGGLDEAPADVVVCTPSWWERNRSLTKGRAVLLVTEDAPGSGASNSMTVAVENGVSKIMIKADSQSTVVEWQLTPMERQILLGPAADLATAPAESTPAVGSAPVLTGVVDIPVAAADPESTAPAGSDRGRGSAPTPPLSAIGNAVQPSVPIEREHPSVITTPPPDAASPGVRPDDDDLRTDVISAVSDTASGWFPDPGPGTALAPDTAFQGTGGPTNLGGHGDGFGAESEGPPGKHRAHRPRS